MAKLIAITVNVFLTEDVEDETEEMRGIVRSIIDGTPNDLIESTEFVNMETF